MIWVIVLFHNILFACLLFSAGSRVKHWLLLIDLFIKLACYNQIFADVFVQTIVVCTVFSTFGAQMLIAHRTVVSRVDNDLVSFCCHASGTLVAFDCHTDILVCCNVAILTIIGKWVSRTVFHLVFPSEDVLSRT